MERKDLYTQIWEILKDKIQKDTKLSDYISNIKIINGNRLTLYKTDSLAIVCVINKSSIQAHISINLPINDKQLKALEDVRNSIRNDIIFFKGADWIVRDNKNTTTVETRQEGIDTSDPNNWDEITEFYKDITAKYLWTIGRFKDLDYMNIDAYVDLENEEPEENLNNPV